MTDTPNTHSFFFVSSHDDDSSSSFDNYDAAVAKAAQYATKYSETYQVFKAVASVSGVTPPHTVTTLTDAPAPAPATA